MNVYEIVIQKIISLLKDGLIPWKPTWKNCHVLPRNIVSDRQYNGINLFLLWGLGYASPYFLTSRQAAQLGGKVKKDEYSNGHRIVFWSIVESEKEKDSAGKPKKIPYLRYHTVYNVEQCENLSHPRLLTQEEKVYSQEEAAIIARGQDVVNSMPNCPSIKHGYNKACYSFTDDVVCMPSRADFNSVEEYFSTLFHELGHATAHKSRLNRVEKNAGIAFSIEEYSFEELVAELTSSFLCADAAISQPETLENQAAYIQGWLKKFQSDPKMIFQAASKAQKAADYIMNRQPVRAEETINEEVANG